MMNSILDWLGVNWSVVVSTLTAVFTVGILYKQFKLQKEHQRLFHFGDANIRKRCLLCKYEPVFINKLPVVFQHVQPLFSTVRISDDSFDDHDQIPPC